MNFTYSIAILGYKYYLLIKLILFIFLKDEAVKNGFPLLCMLQNYPFYHYEQRPKNEVEEFPANWRFLHYVSPRWKRVGDFGRNDTEVLCNTRFRGNDSLVYKFLIYNRIYLLNSLSNSLIFTFYRVILKTKGVSFFFRRK